MRYSLAVINLFFSVLGAALTVSRTAVKLFMKLFGKPVNNFLFGHKE